MPAPARQHRTSLPSFADPSNSRLCSSGTGTSARARARQCWDSPPLGGHSTLNTGPRVTGDNQCYQARGAKSGHLGMKCSHESSAAWSLQSTIEECTITFRVLHVLTVPKSYIYYVGPPRAIINSLWFSPILTCPVLPEPPSVPPEITGVPLQLTSGEWLKVQCHLPWMNVKPQLEFFVNDKKAKHMVSKY